MTEFVEQRIRELKAGLSKALEAIEIDCTLVKCNVCPVRVPMLDKCLHDVISAMVEV